MPLTYSDVMSRTPYLQAARLLPYTGYNAILYARWLPVAVLVPILAAVGIILSLFLPWFSERNLLTTTYYPGFQVASSDIIAGTVVPGVGLVKDTFSFPLLWLLPAIGIALLVLSMLLFRDKVLRPSLSLPIQLSFGLALLIEVVYWITSLYGSFSLIRAALRDAHLDASLAVDVSSGLWVCLLITVIAGGVCIVLFSNLSWYWRLALEDIEQVAKKTNLRPIFEEQQKENVL